VDRQSPPNLSLDAPPAGPPPRPEPPALDLDAKPHEGSARDHHLAPPTQAPTGVDRAHASGRSVVLHGLVAAVALLLSMKVMPGPPEAGGIPVGIVYSEETAPAAPPEPEQPPEPEPPPPEIKSEVPPLEPEPPPPPPKPKPPKKPKPKPVEPTQPAPPTAAPQAEAAPPKGDPDPDAAIGLMPGEEAGPNGGLAAPEKVTPELLKEMVQSKTLVGRSGFLDGVTGRYEGTWTAHFGTDGTSEVVMTYPEYDHKTGAKKTRTIVSKGVWWQEGDRLCFSYREVDQSAKDCFRVVKRGNSVRLFYEKCGMTSTSRCAAGRLAVFGKLNPGQDPALR